MNLQRELLSAILRARDELHLSETETATELGITPSNWSMWKRRGEVSFEGIPRSLDWLSRRSRHNLPAFGALGVSERGADYNVTPGPRIRGTVPLISWVQAGEFTEVEDLLQPGESFERVPTTAPIHEHTFALRVEGDSMMPTFPPGTILIVEPDKDPLPGHFVIVKNGGAATFKQLVRDGDVLLLKPLNSQYPTRPLGDSRIIGVVVKSENSWA